MEERRTHPRTNLRLPVTVLVDRKPIPGDLLDISMGGLLFSCRAPVEIHDSIEVRLDIAPDRSCRGEGQVIRVEQGRGFGVQFEASNDSMREFVADLLKLRDELRSEFLESVMNPTVVVRAIGSNAAQ